LDTKRLRGDAGRGITVYSNDPVRPKLFLTVRARILSSVVLIPDRNPRIDNRRLDESTDRFIVRKEISESGQLTVGEIETSVPWLHVDARPLDPSEELKGLPQPWPGDWLFELKVVGKPDYGRGDQQIRFATGLPREPHVEVDVTVNLLPPVHLASETLVLQPPASAGGSATGSTLISLRRDLADAELDVTTDPSELHVTLEPAGDRYFRVLVDWPRGRDDERREGRIRFEVAGESYGLPVTLAP
jgi:hypothetical protein